MTGTKKKINVEHQKTGFASNSSEYNDISYCILWRMTKGVVRMGRDSQHKAFNYPLLSQK